LIGWKDLLVGLFEKKGKGEFTTAHVIPFTLDYFKLYNEEERFDAPEF